MMKLTLYHRAVRSRASLAITTGAALMIMLMLVGLVSKVSAYCPNDCNNHGYCGDYDRCHCFNDANQRPAWSNADCSGRTCPSAPSFIGSVVKKNDVHPIEECSNKGTCDRSSGQCQCFAGFEGQACEMTVCPNQCNLNGYCLNQQELADEAGRIYSTPWDATKIAGCVCDLGFRGVDCSLVECPSGPDALGGYGNEAGRECSGRGTCDYAIGLCNCYTGFYGRSCQYLASALL